MWSGDMMHTYRSPPKKIDVNVDGRRTTAPWYQFFWHSQAELNMEDLKSNKRSGCLVEI